MKGHRINCSQPKCCYGVLLWHVGFRAQRDELSHCNVYTLLPLVFDFHQAVDGVQEQERQQQAGKK